jgi:effector-binding domain-containing protein
MKIFKYILFLILIVIIGASVYIGTKDGSYDVAVTQQIPAPESLLFEQVNELRNWQLWGPWNEADPEMSVSYGAISAGEGASYAWKSEIEGNGSISTQKTVKNDTILQKITFETPLGDSNSNVYWYFSSKEIGVTNITWGMKGNHSFLEKLFLSFQEEPFDKSLERMFEKGLVNMKNIVEESMNQYQITVEGIKEYGGGYYLYTTATSKIKELGDKMGPMMGKVADFAAQNNITISGMPFTIYSDWDELNGNTIFSTALPINERIIINQGDVLCGYMESLSALKITLKGNYSHLAEAYQNGENYMKQNRLVKDQSRHLFEIYANDPGNLPNPADWLTEIYIPIQRELLINETIPHGNN